MRNKRSKIKNKNELPSTVVKKKPFVKKQRNHKVGNAQKVVHDGIQFQSYLEKTMYSLFIDNGYVIDKTLFYEKAVVTLVEAFDITNDIWINKKSTKSYIMDSKKVRKMQYTPDFTDNPDIYKCTWVVETKGNPNESFPLRFKLFKLWLSKNNPNCKVYVPSNKTQCEETIKLMLNATD
jgi:hypothetical protein